MSTTFPPRARGEYLLFRTQLYLFSIICWAAPIQDTVQIGVDAHDTIIFGAWTCNTVFSLRCTMHLCPAWLKVLVKSVDQSSPAPPTVHHTCPALCCTPRPHLCNIQAGGRCWFSQTMDSCGLLCWNIGKYHSNPTHYPVPGVMLMCYPFVLCPSLCKCSFCWVNYLNSFRENRTFHSLTTMLTVKVWPPLPWQWTVRYNSIVN